MNFLHGTQQITDAQVWDSKQRPKIPILKHCNDLHEVIWTRRQQFQMSDPMAMWNTLCYAFHHMRCAIYVLIVNGTLRAFMPFCNMQYQNNWRGVRTTFRNISEMRATHARVFRRRPENIIPPRLWWANGGLVCNVMPRDGWGQGLLLELYHMMQHTASGTKEFVLNKRDHPLLRCDMKEPYDRIWKSPPEITAYANVWVPHAIRGPFNRSFQDWYPRFAPIRSFYTNDEFADQSLPTTQDWKLSRRPHTFKVPFDAKQPIAAFWGSATGYDVNTDNPRIKCALLAKEHPTMLHANLTSWNPRHKFTRDGEVTFVRPSDFPALSVGPHNFMTPEQQESYKFIIYLDGQVGASRLGFMLLMGSVVLLRRSSAPQPWLYDRLIDWVHVVPIREDLSDLVAKIQWCRNNESKCKLIALNGTVFAREAIQNISLVI